MKTFEQFTKDCLEEKSDNRRPLLPSDSEFTPEEQEQIRNARFPDTLRDNLRSKKKSDKDAHTHWEEI